MPQEQNNKAIIGEWEQEEDTESKDWLTTYADMITLLMVFFVMIVAMSNMNTERFEQVMTSIQFSMGQGKSEGGYLGRIDLHRVREQSLTQTSGKENEPLLKDIRQTLKKKNLEDNVEVFSQDGKVIINVKGQILFDSASSAFNRNAASVLNEVAKIVRNWPGYRLNVRGHTDPRPISTAKFANNWELSALRATAVLRYLMSQGVDPRRMTATGYADTDPLVPNTNEENMARNRRVEFVLEKERR